MKRLFLFAGVLMVGATIYGFVDYSKTKHNKRFNSLYHKKEQKEFAVPASKEDNEVLKEDNKKNLDKITDANTAAKSSLIKRNTTKDKKDRKRRGFTYKSFSRAPLKESYEVIKIDSTIKPIKTKDQ